MYARTSAHQPARLHLSPLFSPSHYLSLPLHLHRNNNCLRQQWGGLMLVYLLGQRRAFNAFHYLTSWLHISETGAVATTTSGNVSKSFVIRRRGGGKDYEAIPTRGEQK